MTYDFSKLASSRKSRRSVLSGLGAAAVGLTFSGKGFAADKAEEAKLNFYNWDTYIGETTLDDFQESQRH